MKCLLRCTRVGLVETVVVVYLYLGSEKQKNQSGTISVQWQRFENRFADGYEKCNGCFFRLVISNYQPRGVKWGHLDKCVFKRAILFILQFVILLVENNVYICLIIRPRHNKTVFLLPKHVQNACTDNLFVNDYLKYSSLLESSYLSNNVQTSTRKIR